MNLLIYIFVVLIITGIIIACFFIKKCLNQMFSELYTEILLSTSGKKRIQTKIEKVVI